MAPLPSTSSKGKRKRRTPAADDAADDEEPPCSRVRREKAAALHVLTAMWDQRQLMDCRLLVREQPDSEPVVLHAHRAVLAAASRPFHSMLCGSLRESGSFKIEMNEVDPAMLHLVLQFMYGREVILSLKNALPLYRLADMYEVLELADLCCTYLKKQADAPQHCCELLASADAVSCAPVVAHCVHVLTRNFEAASRSPGFLALPQPLFLDLLREDTLSVRSEEAVLDALLRWLDHDPTAREPSLPALAQAVRWAAVSAARLAGLEVDRPSFAGVAEVKELLAEAYRFQALTSHLRETKSAGAKDGAQRLLRTFSSARTAPRRRRCDFSSLTFQHAVGTKGGHDSAFNCPEGVAVARNGNIVVADSLNHRVQVFTEDGEFVRAFGENGSAHGQFNMPGGIAVGADEAGEEIIVVTDQGNGRLQVFDSQGVFLRQVGQPGIRDGALLEPTGVGVTASGDIVVADYQNHRVQVFDRSGEFKLKFGKNGKREGEFNHPSGISLTHEGHIVVADYQNDRLQIFDQDGTFLRAIGKHGSGPGEFDRPFDVAVSSDGHILVTDYENHRVQVFSEGGSFLHEFGSHGSGEGQFDSPGGVAVSADGRVCVTDCGNGRLQTFVPKPAEEDE